MRSEHFTLIELWAIGSKARAFGFLLGLAIIISTCLTGAATLLVSVAQHGLTPPAVASTQR